MQLMRNRSVFVLLLILLIGLLTVPAYGAHLDQGSEQRILFSNIKEYLLHIPNGKNMQLVQDMTDLQVLEISIDEDRDHGIAIYYPIFFLWWVNQNAPYWGSVIWHIYTFLLVFFGMCSLFFLGKELFENEGLAVFTVLLFILTPRMFAESHYNDKDMVLLSLVFCVFYQMLRLMRTKSWNAVFMFALAGALAANLKIIGIWIFGVAGLYVLFYFIASGQYDKKLAGKTVSCILLFFGLFILLTPACWNQMGDYLSYLYHNAVDYDLWHDYVLFQGRMIHRDYTGMPKKYLPVLILLTTPVIILLLSIIGGLNLTVRLIRSRFKALWEREGFLLAVLLACGVPLAYAVLSATPLYNGWRHFYFVYASIILIAGYGARKLWEFAQKHRKEKIAIGSGLVYLCALAVGIACNYPQEHCYYNILAGNNVAENYELDYWDMSVKQAYEMILKQTEEAVCSVGALNLPTLWGLDGQLKVLPAKDRVRFNIAEEWTHAEYLIVNTSYAFMYSGEDYQSVKENYEFLGSISSYGNVICEVYAKGETD